MNGVITPCITFDPPRYIKALDISKKMAMDIVICLGRFHTMNFLVLLIT